jgi:Ni/Co efflux regulator RcnB
MKYRIASLSALLVIGLFSSASALAAPPGNNHGHRQSTRQSAPPKKHYSSPPKQQYSAPPARRVSAPPRHTQRHMKPLPRSKYASHHRHGRSWQMGRAVPRTVVYHDVSSPHIYGLAPPPRNHRYVRVGTDILLLAIGTGLIVNALYDIAY